MTSHVTSFNVDLSNFHIFEGERGSRFGFSSTFWQDTEGKKWVVVGAPMLSRSFTTSLRNPRIIGGIQVCDKKSKCQTIQSLPVVSWNDEDPFQVLRLASDNILSIGLGETIHAAKTSHPLLVCSPRNLSMAEEDVKEEGGEQYTMRLMSHRGLCYLLDTIHSEPKVLLPFPDKHVLWWNTKYQTLSDNAGMGAFLSEEEDMVLIGLPSMYWNEGGVCKYNLLGVHSFSYSKKQPLLTSHYVSESEGWAIVGGKFDGKHKYYAVSIPGQPFMYGQVVFYSRNLKMVPKLQLNGSEPGAAFGHSLISGDFNGDQIADLAVSAHLSSVDAGEILPDAGKVLIYYSPILHMDNDPKVSILRGMASSGYFGYAIMSPGDLNGDVYDDLVVGAPYEEAGGKVYVFNGSPEGLLSTYTQVISQSTFIKPGFRLQQGIGFSLGGGIDIDSNGYPDILIGAQSSDSVILLRSAPVLTLKINASFGESGIISLGKRKCQVIQDEFAANLSCFSMNLQVHYISQEFKEKLAVDLQLQLDTKVSNPRLVFADLKNVWSFKRDITYKPEPFDVTVHVKPFKQLPKGLIHTKVRAKLSKRGSREKDQNEDSDSLSSPRIEPILDHFTDHEFVTTARLVCANLEDCLTKPDLALKIQGNEHFTVGLKEPLFLNISLFTRGDPAFQIRLRGSIPSEFTLKRVLRGHGFESDEIVCQKSSSNTIATAETAIICYLTDLLPIWKKFQFSLLIDHQPTNMTEEMFRIKEGVVQSFNFSFTAFSDTRDPNEEDNTAIWTMEPIIRVDFLLVSTAVPYSAIVWTNDTDAMRKAKKIFDARSRKNSNQTSPMAFDASDYIGPNLTHTYTVINTGPSPIVDSKVVISWPTHFRGFPLLLFRKNIITAGHVICEPLEDELTIEYYREKQPSFEDDDGASNHLRRKRNTHSKTNDPREKENLLDVSGTNDTLDTIKNIDCSSTECVYLRCTVGPLLAREEVTIEINAIAIATLFNMLGYRQILITSEILLENTLLALRNSSTTATHIAVKSLELTAFELVLQQWWILLLSIVGGALILVLIVGIFYKVGFFKRKRVRRDPDGLKGRSAEALFVHENIMCQLHPPKLTPMEERKDYITNTSDTQTSDPE